MKMTPFLCIWNSTLCDFQKIEIFYFFFVKDLEIDETDPRKKRRQCYTLRYERKNTAYNIWDAFSGYI